MERIFVEGLNYRTSGLGLMEKLHIPAKQQREALAHLMAMPGVKECMILSTCNRTDIYYVSSGEKSSAAAMDALCALKNVGCNKHRSSFYTYRGAEAVEHVFRVASSLDSMIIGEHEVTGQFKDSFAAALENKAIGRSLYALFQAAMAVEKRVRNSTDISKGAVSVSHSAVELAAGIFGTLKGKKVLLIGAGKMAQMAAGHFRKKGAGAIDVLNKTYEKAVTLSKEFGGMSYGFASLKDAVVKADIVLASTGSENPVIKTGLIRKIMAERKEPLHIIDIAVPRDTEPGIKKISNVHVHDMDDLKGHVEKNMAKRKQEHAKADKLVKQAVARFEKLLVMKNMAPVIKGIKEKVYKIAVEESARTARENNMAPEAAKLVEKNAIAVVDVIINRHMSGLKKKIDSGEGHEDLIKLIKDEFKT